MKDDAGWQLASVGMQPENPNEVDVDNDDFTEIEKENWKMISP
jgi:hypothetical protein